MRDYMTVEDMRATKESYVAAYERVAGLFPNCHMQPQGNHRWYQEAFEFRFNTPAFEDFAKHANSASVAVADLFDRSHPKCVEPGQWIWSSDFVKFGLGLTVSYDHHSTDAACYRCGDGEDDKGEHIPAKSRVEKRNIYIDGPYKTAGLGNWASNYTEMLKLAELIGDPETRSKAVQGLHRADQEATRWRESIAGQVKKMQALGVAQ